MTGDPAAPIQDPRSTVDLGDGMFVAWCIGADGTAWPWLLLRGHNRPDEAGCNCSGCAGHEQDGPLPTFYRRRLAIPSRPRCGRPCADGHACRVRVAHHGDACHHHTFEAAS